MIQITKPFLPPLEAYKEYLEGVWERNWLTNDGPLVNELEGKLKDRFGINHMLYVSSGTIALQFAIRALELEGEIITTPFSYVATTSSIVWENCYPKFVDILPDTFSLDPAKIEDAITDETTAIIATHVFGIPCEVEKIQQIAKKHNLKVIYDAAHCFDTCYKGDTIFKWGDISVTSYHATKLFQTVEGGAIFTGSERVAQKVEYMRNFGHDGFGKFNGVGINGKNSEFHAAMGLCNLQYIDEILAIRRKQCKEYNKLLKTNSIFLPNFLSKTELTLAYYPIVLQNETVTLKVKNCLENAGIGTRRYFYPSLNTLDYVRSCSTPIAEDIASRILCLPLYHSLTSEDQERIANTLEKCLQS